MRSAGNFSPEWGYLAPAPSFMRTARIVMVATAIGATAGAGVVLSLVDHPSAEGETTSLIGAQAIVTAVHAATPASVPLANAAPVTAAIAPVAVPAQVAAPVRPQSPAQATPQVQAPVQAVAAPPAAVAAPANADSANTASVPNPAPGIASLSEGAPAADAVPADAADSTAIAPPPKKAKHQGPGYASNGAPGKPRRAWNGAAPVVQHAALGNVLLPEPLIEWRGTGGFPPCPRLFAASEAQAWAPVTQ